MNFIFTAAVSVSSQCWIILPAYSMTGSVLFFTCKIRSLAVDVVGVFQYISHSNMNSVPQ